jgi:hypothetical protein
MKENIRLTNPRKLYEKLRWNKIFYFYWIPMRNFFKTKLYILDYYIIIHKVIINITKKL